MVKGGSKVTSDDILPKTIRDMRTFLKGSSAIAEAAKLHKSMALTSSQYQAATSFASDMQRMSDSLKMMDLKSINEAIIPKGMAELSLAMQVMSESVIPERAAAMALEIQSAFEMPKAFNLQLSSQLIEQQEIISSYFKEHELNRIEPLKSISLFEGLDNLPAAAKFALELTRNMREDITSNISSVKLNSELDESLISEIKTSNDYNDLSYKAKRLLIGLIFCISFVIQSLITSYTTPYLRGKLDALVNPSDSKIKKSVLGIDNDTLKLYRVISGSRVNIRQHPSIKSEILNTLGRGTLVTIIDKSNRTWLEVEYEIDGKTYTGWVSRKYALRLHK